jgi:glycosyltransferase involved in cell wall biosynthesis
MIELLPAEITIVYPPAIDYFFMHQRPQQMMKALAEVGANVIFINPADLFDQDDKVYYPFPHLPNFLVLHRSIDFRNYVKGKVVFWCAVNQSSFIQSYSHDLAVFDSCDLPSDEFSAWKELIPVMEKNTQITFASSFAIYHEHIMRGIETVMLPNGSDYEHFKHASTNLMRPDDMPDTKGAPLIGYYGAIYTWMDLELVYAIADKYPVVLIGSNKLYNLSVSHHNITMLDMKPYQQLPNYLSWFDVAIIPFKLSHMIKGCDPVKFYEYIAAGKPVVASEMQELKKFSSYIYFANKSNISEMVNKALSENNSAKVRSRQRVALKNSWRNRANTALAAITNRLLE